MPAKLIDQILAGFNNYAKPSKAKHLSRFFKTGPGEYGEGDHFLGLTMPETRSVLKDFQDAIDFNSIQYFFDSKWHEHRMFAALSCVYLYKKQSDKNKVFQFYKSNFKSLNNWDLIDASCHIVGEHYLNDWRSLLPLAKSNDLWVKRISMVSTMVHIRNNILQPTIEISKILLPDTHDLIHKASGWMLRELGKRDIKLLDKFIEEYYNQIPRTMLRYAIEKHPENIRQKILKGDFK